MERGKLFMTVITETIGIVVLMEGADMKVLIVSRAVTMIGIMIVFEMEKPDTNMESIDQDQGGNIYQDPDPLLVQRAKGPLDLTWHHLLQA
ncbi:hypothetical protein TanjilG_26606 [Lupinus angustifolius]|uniref:Uncharacterized protein n=1 Tax=Lupinus angustifolius TaxID=3871 RepID=A0A4P1QPU7_LUPAN|nr:hypothetical protein TanjilG_26606 [Lupinus angustifolius]